MRPDCRECELWNYQFGFASPDFELGRLVDTAELILSLLRRSSRRSTIDDRLNLTLGETTNH